MTALKAAGVDILVCALTPPELRETGLGAAATLVILNEVVCLPPPAEAMSQRLS
jgi:hypothetical protein